MGRQAVTVRVARWSATRPWRAIGLWIAFVVACVVIGGAVGTTKATTVDIGTGESGRAARVAHDHGVAEPALENVLITARSGGALDHGQARVAAAEVAKRMRALPDVAEVGTATPSPKGDALLVPVTMRGDPETAPDRVDPLLKATEAVQNAHPDLRVEESGDGSVQKGLGKLLVEDLLKADMFGLPITLILMLVAFGAIIAAGVPVLLAITAVGGAVGLTALVSHLIPMYDSSTSMIMLMGMAVGIDYSLFYLKREREERAKGRGHVDAIEIAAATSGHSVVVSALAVIVSMAGLFLTQHLIFSSLAAAAILVVAVAMVGSVTVLPAILSKLGRRVDRPRVPVVWRLTQARTTPPRLWPALLRPALRRPLATLLVSVAALSALALPAFGLDLRSTTADELPRAIPAMQSYDRLTAAFPGETTSHLVVVQAPAGQSNQVEQALHRLVTKTDRAGGNGDRLFVPTPGAQVRESADRQVHTVKLSTPYGINSKQAQQAVKQLRTDLVPSTVGKVAGAEHWVGGGAADSHDFGARLEQRMPWVIGFVLLLTFLMMAVIFRSVVVALTAIAVNVLSVGASFGALVLIFQHGWGAGLLGFTATGHVIAWIPLFLFAVLFGLSMDYHVFVVSRIREAALNGMPTRQAVAEGITRSAGVVTSAAVVMIAVFSVFGALRMMDMKQMGIGLAVAVFIDAVVIRIVVLPSLMALLGRANWWPSHLSRGSGRGTRHGTPRSSGRGTRRGDGRGDGRRGGRGGSRQADLPGEATRGAGSLDNAQA
ncbi:MMPL family transporter [Actinomadura barringtoniae]|uniref:MMPL family transporter n=1 Tax=Actinomadura barringtoniae TaxID=1427535 RepID=A0A939T755_9ACTN|nr:MMPL family transporter [Actinomadura barringtoniae]MBO2445540.1 MMPL family transporter [Actinomadura barringtoniae]